ncbi:MAG: hypothetical protein DVB28_000622 [Verrucomicrobia bacterium]|nr:MAG: hypothetical protein DVB28_000622 [Verrucomicrobiota bacterium]
MSPSPSTRTLLLTVAGLFGGVALGTILPTASPRATNSEWVPDSTAAGANRQKSTQSVSDPAAAISGTPSSTLELRSLGKLPPEKIVALFEKVASLRSETRRYILAYRLASQMELDQVEAALQTALHDLSDGGDYVTARALARRWTELDPKAAAAKALETKQQHLVIPVMESWTRMDPSAPLAWALQQVPDSRAEAVRPLLMGRLLDQTQLEKLVMNAAGSESDEMRRQIFPFATTRLSDTNPQGALHAASSIEDAELRQRTLMMVMGHLGKSAPEVARAWLNTQQEIPAEQKLQLEQMLASPRKGAGTRGVQ